MRTHSSPFLTTNRNSVVHDKLWHRWHSSQPGKHALHKCRANLCNCTLRFHGTLCFVQEPRAAGSSVTISCPTRQCIQSFSSRFLSTRSTTVLVSVLQLTTRNEHTTWWHTSAKARWATTQRSRLARQWSLLVQKTMVRIICNFGVPVSYSLALNSQKQS